MKICLVDLNPEAFSRDFHDIATKVSQRVLRSGNRMDVKSVKTILTHRDFVSSYYFSLLNEIEVIEGVIEAEKEGYDAAVVNCFQDTGVREAREVVNIPVIGLAEPSMLFACLLGNKFAVVTINEPKIVLRIRMLLEEYGLQDRAIPNPVRPVSLPTRELFRNGFEDPQFLASVVMEKAKECVQDGAEVVAVGCGVLGPPCAVAGVVKVEGVNAPLLDCLSVTLKTVETIMDLEATLGLPFISRVGMYASPRDKDLKRVRALLGLEGMPGSITSERRKESL